MRIGRNTVAVGLAAEVVQLCFVQATFQISAPVNARRGVALDVHHVATELLGAATEEVLEAHIVENGRRGIGGDVPTHVRMLAGAQHHGQRVPADVGVYPAFYGQVAGIRLLTVQWNGIDVGRGDAPVKIAMAVGVEIQHLVNQVVGARPPLDARHRFNGFEPFASFLWILVEEHGLLCHRCLLLDSAAAPSRLVPD
ncbi:hypothetical protein D3C76_993610 [compost metagenome]